MLGCQFLLLFATLFLLDECASFHAVDIDLGDVSLTFQNVSLGLHYNYLEIGHQCDKSGHVRGKLLDGGKAALAYTPNRRTQDSTLEAGLRQQLRLAVVLAVGGHSDSHYNYGPGGSINGLMAVWDSWAENFFAVTSNTTSLVLLFDERDFRRQNNTRSKAAYLDNIIVGNMAARPAKCLHMRGDLAKAGGRHGCSNELYLDQGYRVYYLPLNATTRYQKPMVIFAAVHSFPLPAWVKSAEEEDELFKSWKPWRLNRRYPTNYGYVKMTNWYAYYMLKLQLLDFFDYGGKLDNDVSFVSPFPEPNLPNKLAQAGSFMLATQNGWYYDDPRISQGVALCLRSYMTMEAKHCNDLLPKGTSRLHDLLPAGGNDTTFLENTYNTTFRAHFLVYWLGLYTAPETKHLAKFWNDFHPRGMWDYRWGDQQWWPRPIALFGMGNLSKEIIHYNEINTDNEKYVVHKEWPRYSTIPKVMFYNSINGSTKEERDRLFNAAAKKCVKWHC